MAIDTTIHRDAEGHAMLTIEQAENICKWAIAAERPRPVPLPKNRLLEASPIPPMPIDETATVAALGVETSGALARWVLRWAPVVRAAVVQAEAARVGLRHGEFCCSTDAAVRAAHGAVQHGE